MLGVELGKRRMEQDLEKPKTSAAWSVPQKGK
jgi:hypothetical protein